MPGIGQGTARLVFRRSNSSIFFLIIRSITREGYFKGMCQYCSSVSAGRRSYLNHRLRHKDGNAGYVQNVVFLIFFRMRKNLKSPLDPSSQQCPDHSHACPGCLCPGFITKKLGDTIFVFNLFKHFTAYISDLFLSKASLLFPTKKSSCHSPANCASMLCHHSIHE